MANSFDIFFESEPDPKITAMIRKMGEKKFIGKIKKDRRVEAISDERDYRGSDLEDPEIQKYIKMRGENGDGFWIYLKPPWRSNLDDGHTIHEDSLADAYRQLQFAEKS